MVVGESGGDCVHKKSPLTTLRWWRWWWCSGCRRKNDSLPTMSLMKESVCCEIIRWLDGSVEVQKQNIKTVRKTSLGLDKSACLRVWSPSLSVTIYFSLSLPPDV